MPELGGQGVIVTRPADQQAELVDCIRAANGEPLCLAALEIAPRDPAAIRQDAERLDAPDITLFVSPNAVRYGLDFAGGNVGAIGPGTAAAIRARDIPVDIVPEAGFNSEHLLESDALRDIAGKTIRIIRGQTGRELLGATLAHRGGHVDYLSVYERRCPQHDRAEVDALLDRWASGKIAAWTIMSVETLDNFLTLIGEKGRDLAARTPLVTPAERVLKEAEERLPGVFVALSAGTSAQALVDAVDGVIVHEPL